MIPYSDAKVLGPYNRPDGRQHIVVCYNGGTKSTVSYPKYLLELKLGRYLEITEVCHHLDGNHLNNYLDNLEVKLRSEHSSKHENMGNQEFNCVTCNKVIVLSNKQSSSLRSERKRGKTGPYCVEHRPVNQYV
jgi:hypothetical protein